MIKLPGAPVDQKAEALVNRGFRYSEKSDNEKAIADYSEVINLPGAPVDQKAKAHTRLGSRTTSPLRNEM